MTIVAWPFPPAPSAPPAVSAPLSATRPTELRLEGRIAPGSEFAGWNYQAFLDDRRRPRFLCGGAPLVLVWPPDRPGKDPASGPVRLIYAPADWLQFEPERAA